MWKGRPGRFALGGERHLRLDVAPVSIEVAGDVMQALLAPCKGGPPPELVQAGVKVAGGNVGLLHATVRLFRDSGVLEEADPGSKPSWNVHLDKLERVQLPVSVEETVSMRLAALAVSER